MRATNFRGFDSGLGEFPALRTVLWRFGLTGLKKRERQFGKVKSKSKSYYVNTKYSITVKKEDSLYPENAEVSAVKCLTTP